jgi:hypothetical protein
VGTCIAPTMPDHFRLSTAETRSETMRFDKTAMPPAPIPWTVRPMSMPVKFPDMAAIKLPHVKNVIAARSSGLRPKIVERVENSGEQTVAAKRNEITSQKDCRAVLPSVDAIVCINYQSSHQREGVKAYW